MRTLRRLGLLLTTLTVGLTPALLMGGVARAAGGITYHVRTTGMDSSCTAGRSGAAPLRTIGFAVACANGDSTTPASPDTIVIAGGTYDENNLIIAANVHLLGTSGVTIDGQENPGQESGFDNPIVLVNGAFTVAINNVGLTDGGNGGALVNVGGTVTFSNGAISDNVGTQNPPGFPSAGDGITNVAGTMTVTNATVSGNASTQFGDAILVLSGGMTVANSAVTGNSVECEGVDGCTGAAGGGIWNGGALTITNSTIANNTVTCDHATCFANGAGILNGEGFTTFGTVLVQGSQVEGNTASCSSSSCTARGGGIVNAFGTFTVRNSRVDGNTASCTGSSCIAQGGGVYNAPTTPLGTVALINSQISENAPDNCEPIGSISGCTN
jgi:hypothetical protein